MTLLIGCAGDTAISPPELTLSALEVEPGIVNYALILTNRSDETIRGLELSITIPAGMGPEMVLTIPQGAGLVDSGPSVVTWSLSELRPHQQAGPFAYRATVVDPTTHWNTGAVVRWLSPSKGETTVELAGWESAYDIEAMQIIPPHGPPGPTVMDGSGIRYHASPDAGGMSLFIRIESPGRMQLPPALSETIWVSSMELSVTGAGEADHMAVVVPSSIPLQPYSLAEVWAETDADWERSCWPAQVTPDGQHLVMVPPSVGRLAIGVAREGIEDPAPIPLPITSDVLAVWGDFTPISYRRVNPAGGTETEWGLVPVECGAPLCLARGEEIAPLPAWGTLPGIFHSQPASSTLWLLSVTDMPTGIGCTDTLWEGIEIGWTVGMTPIGNLTLVLAAMNAEPLLGSMDQAGTLDEAPDSSRPLDFTWRILAAHRMDEGWSARIRIEPTGGTGFYICLGPDGSPCGIEADGYYIDVESRSVCEPWVGGVSVISGEDRVDRTLQIDPGFCHR